MTLYWTQRGSNSSRGFTLCLITRQEEVTKIQYTYRFVLLFKETPGSLEEPGRDERVVYQRLTDEGSTHTIRLTPVRY